MKIYFNHKISNFEGGQLSKCLSTWKQHTKNPEILEAVKGDVIEFEDGCEIPISHNSYNQNFTIAESFIISQEIEKLLKKNIIKETIHEKTEFVSSIFLKEKPDGSFRFILNLKKFNKSVKYKHFKMENISTVLKYITPNCYMTSLDLKDAYFSVKIRED